MFVCLQLLYLGFQRDSSEAALRLAGGDVQAATQLLLDNQGVLSSELLSQPLSSPSSEEPSTSSTTPGRARCIRLFTSPTAGLELKPKLGDRTSKKFCQNLSSVTDQ